MGQQDYVLVAHEVELEGKGFSERGARVARVAWRVRRVRRPVGALGGSQPGVPGCTSAGRPWAVGGRQGGTEEVGPRISFSLAGLSACGERGAEWGGACGMDS